MGRTSQQKGRRAEIELSRLLNERGYHTRPGEAVSFGREANIVGLDGVHIEVKRRECPDISAVLRQAREDAAASRLSRNPRRWARAVLMEVCRMEQVSKTHFIPWRVDMLYEIEPRLAEIAAEAKAQRRRRVRDRWGAFGRAKRRRGISSDGVPAIRVCATAVHGTVTFDISRGH